MNNKLCRRAWAPIVSVAMMAAALCSAWAPAAEADTVRSALLNSTVGLSINSLTVTSLELQQGGTLEVKLTDMKWTDAFQTLSFALMDSKGVLTDSTGAQLKQTIDATGSGLLSYAVSGPMTLFVSVYAVPLAGKTGLYNLDCDSIGTVTAVPLPASGWLLLSAVTGLAALRRKTVGRQHTGVTNPL